MNLQHKKYKTKKYNVRSIIALSIALTFVVIFFGRLFKLQIVDAEKYKDADDKISAYTSVVTATRGEILDRNGQPLVTNRSGNSVVFIAAYFPPLSAQEKRNEIINSLIDLFEASGEEYNKTLPLEMDKNGNVYFSDGKDEEIKFLKSKKVLNLNDYATAQNCFDALVEKFSLQEYPKLKALKIASVCFALKQIEFSVANPYTFAEDVSSDIIAKIKENNSFYQGVEIEVKTYREYVDGGLAAHVLGTVGAINSEEYKEKKEEKEEKLKDKSLSSAQRALINRSGYSITSQIGKDGIEQIMEGYLRGVDGEKAIITDADGNTKTEYSVIPQQGDTVILTIDADLQKIAQDSLAKRAKEVAANGLLPPAGAIMVMDIKTGEILTSASYPSYNLKTYKEDYSDLLKAKGSPLWNRALLSTYQPGSTIKPAVALSALDNGTITTSTKITCNQHYTYFKDTVFSCLGSHGSIDVSHAILHSCNIFFYETGRRMGIDKMSEYLSKFGLGQKTGVELPEASGMIASAENREARGGVWNPGDTVQAAIGQSDQLFTPIQLLNYVAMVANGGTRYVPHFIKSVVKSDYSETILEKKPEVEQEISFDKSALEAVGKGMNLLCTVGSCSSAFSKLNFNVAAKTGTSQVVNIVNGTKIESNNGFVISYAPYEDPEIAVVAVIENSSSGAAVATVVADVYEYYFGTKNNLSRIQSGNTLLP